jgi:hypothetical protein
MASTEGNGVLHRVWAWVGKRSFYIPQDWLSSEWEKIHGAPVVWVRKMRIDRKDIKRVGRYFVSGRAGTSTGMAHLRACFGTLYRQNNTIYSSVLHCGRGLAATDNSSRGNVRFAGLPCLP